MSIKTLLVLPSLLMLCVGCDGHARRITLFTQTATPLGSESVSLSFATKERIIRVAEVLRLSRVGDRDFHWKIDREDRSVFELMAHQEPSGAWTVILRDWPSFIRSDLSREAERLLKAEAPPPKNEEANQALEPTPIAVTFRAYARPAPATGVAHL
jgi:hypothetical protein